MYRFHVGDLVYWADPDDNLCDTQGTVIEVKDDDVYVVQLDSGGIVEAFDWELGPVDPGLRRARA